MSSLCFFLSQPAWDGKIGTVISNAKKKKDFSNISIKFFSSVQLLSHARLSVTPWMQHARLPCPSPTPGACPNSCPLTSIHLILCHPFLLLPSVFPRIRVFSHKSVLYNKWPKYWSFSFSISPFNEYSGLISFRIDWLDILAVQVSLKSFLQHQQSKSMNSLVLSFLYRPTHTSIHDYWKTIALTIWIFVSKVMSQLFNKLSSFVIAFLPRSKGLLISWLKPLSAVILEPKKIKSLTVPIISPYICHEVMRLDATIFVF